MVNVERNDNNFATLPDTSALPDTIPPASPISDVIIPLRRRIGASPLSPGRSSIARTQKPLGRNRSSPVVDVDLPDALGEYLHNIGDIPLLSAEQEHTLFTSMKRGDKQARNQLIEANLRLVVAIAKRYQYVEGMELFDLIQEGNLGLIHAIGSFDASKGFKLSTHATHVILHFIRNAIVNTSKTIRWPKNFVRDVKTFQRVWWNLYETDGHIPTTQKLAESLHMSPSAIQKLVEMQWQTQQPESLDALIKNGTTTLLDRIASALPTADTSSAQQRKVILDALEELLPRDREVLTLRLGLDGNKSWTLQEVGDKLGITRERVRQLEERALQRLRSSSFAAALRQTL